MDEPRITLIVVTTEDGEEVTYRRLNANVRSGTRVGNMWRAESVHGASAATTGSLLEDLARGLLA